MSLHRARAGGLFAMLAAGMSLVASAAPPGQLPNRSPASGLAQDTAWPPAALAIQGDLRLNNPSELKLDDFVALVLARNPNVQAMTAAWRAAAARYPQAVSLDDPVFNAMMAPATFFSNQLDAAYVLQASQKFPTNGKRGARGRVVAAEAGAAYAEVVDARLRIREAATIAYFDYFLVYRQLQLNDENRTAVAQFRSAALARYQANTATEQDVLQADVQLIELDRKQIELERMREVARSRLNTFLLRPPDDSLPPPPPRVPDPAELPPVAVVRDFALRQRPDLAAILARIRTEQAALDLARREYTPDIDLFAGYNSMWQPASVMKDMRGQVGVNVNLPRHARRNSAVREASFRLAQRRAEYDQRVADIQFEVQSAYEQVRESSRTVTIFNERLLPTARQNVASALANYNVGKIDFLTLIQAERQLIELRDRHQQALADYYRRLATLERAVAGPLPPAAESLPPPSRELFDKEREHANPGR
jgi:outer membrane protein TolC